jgi:hypothetical protein
VPMHSSCPVATAVGHDPRLGDVHPEKVSRSAYLGQSTAENGRIAVMQRSAESGYFLPYAVHCRYSNRLVSCH